MVKITNGVNVFEVTNGAFDGIFSHQGYTIVGAETAIPQVEEVTTPVVPEKTEDERFLEEVVEKPISQWDKEEIKRFAALKGIDLSGTRTADEARELILNFIETEDETEAEVEE